MLFLTNIKLSFKNLLIHKSRSFLAMLGIIIGVASVISIMAVGNSAEDLLLSQVQAMGSNLVGILPGGSEEDEPPAAIMGIEITTLKYEDALAIENLPHIQAVCPYVSGRATVTYQNKAEDFDYTGIGPSYLEVQDTDIQKGRFIRQEDVDNMAKAAVIGSEVKEKLFGKDEALNKRIKIGQVSFKVIGIMEERGVVGFENQDLQIYVPIKTAQKILLGVDHLSFVRAKVDNSDNINIAISQIEKTLRFRHNIKDPKKVDFSVKSSNQAVEILGAVTQALKMFLAMVAAISLLVGGIGIMNIMFVVVNERTREVGLRKALGAERKNILVQFLIESVIMTSIGGLFGIITGILIALAVSIGVNYYGYDWKFIITISSVLTAVLTAASVGLVFGLWPANRASKLDAIKALRYE